MTELNINLPSVPSASSLPDSRKKSVRFSDVDVLATYYHEESASTNHDDSPSPHPTSLPLPPKSWKVRERRSQASLETNFRGRYLSIQPGDELVFENRIAKSPEKESVDVIRLANIASTYVAFKVKTTAPEKFRVKPSFGCIENGGSKTVEVSVMPGLSTASQKDRGQRWDVEYSPSCRTCFPCYPFLIMSVPLESEPKSHSDLVDFWHDLLKNEKSGALIDEHKLKCTILPAAGEATRRNVAGEPEDADSKIANVVDRLDSLDSKLDYLLNVRNEKSAKAAVTRASLFSTALVLILVFFVLRILLLIFVDPSENFPQPLVDLATDSTAEAWVKQRTCWMPAVRL